MKTKVLLLVMLLLWSSSMFSQGSKDSKIKPTRMEKSNFLGLRTTIYKVKDIQKAKEWYTKAFGIAPYFDKPFYVGYNIGGFELGLQPMGEKEVLKGENVVTYWGVEDISKTYKDLIAIGAIENEKPYNVGGELMTATVKDPFGNIIGLVYNPYFKLKE